jgi:hypothetical protein
MPVRWTYSNKGQFTSSLFYWLKGGVDSDFCFNAERESRPKLLGAFVSDPRIVDYDDDAGLLDQCDFDRNSIECPKCRSTTLEEFTNAKFAVVSKHLESFVGSTYLNGIIAVHKRLIPVFDNAAILGAKFLEQQPIKFEERQSPSGKFTSKDDLLGQHFGTYKILLGSSWIREGKKVLLDATPCLKCGNPFPFFCSECNDISIYCFDCRNTDKLREEPSIEMERFRFALDLSDWNGDDIVNSFDGLCVSGRVIELLRATGQTCFTYGPINCDISHTKRALMSRIDELSRSMGKLDSVFAPFSVK